MQPERWRQIDELLGRVLEIPARDRAAFLDAACAGDEALRVQLDELLRAHAQADNFLVAPALITAAGQIAGNSSITQVGRTLGHYEVLSRLGAGGMGVVYLARDLRLDRMVALKFLPHHLDIERVQKLRFLREAKASAALEHPNIGAVHEIAEAADGQLFIVMGYYEGVTLKQRIQQGPLVVNEAVAVASQIAAGLAHAHGRGIVHRDIKPGNILVNREGAVRIIDFGLAKFRGMATGASGDPIMGTVSYLSPEQARGEEVDQRTDLWSLGAVFYEMLAGQAPFRGPHPGATIQNILAGQPAPLHELRPDVPTPIERIVGRALQKDVKSRYPSAAEFLGDLTAYQAGTLEAEPAPVNRRWIGAWLTQKRIAVPAISILIVLAAVLVPSTSRWKTERWVRNTVLPEISRLIEREEYAAAFALARRAEQYVPADPQLVRLWPLVSRTVSVRTTPPGADVSIKEYEALDSEWTYLGKSPLDNVRVPRGLFRWKVEKHGFGTVDGVASGSFRPNRPITFVLDSVQSIPAGMVRVQGGHSPYNMTVSGFENVEPIQVPDYWMDRYEVSNRQFKQFVDAGGYQRREYWKHPFVKDGRVVAWEVAMSVFRDATGRPGPSTWEAGDHPRGQDEYPVGGVSWYEAAAYAEFVGKSLPSVYHWNRAAITGDAWISPYILPHSNFAGRGPARLGRHQGMSRSGNYDMAGNVKEWCWNEAAPRKRYILGGGWNEPAYMFHEADARSPWQRDAMFGFRCMKEAGQASASPRLMAAVAASTRSYAKEEPVSDKVFQLYRSLFAYDRTPLNPSIDSTDTSETDWISQRVTFDAAYGNERMAAYLFLPRSARPPYQTVVHFPGAESIFVRSSAQLVEMSRIDFLLKSGRAVVWPIYKGTYERPDGLQTYFPDTTVRYRDRVIQWAKDLGRSLDYLESRPDFDRSKVAFYGFSWGAGMGAILPAVEDRLKVSVLMGPGLFLEHARPEVDQINFAPRVTIPTLMLDGRDDFVFPSETSQQPFFRLLGTPKEHKRLVVFEGGHTVPRQHLIRESLDWFDRYLGPVQRTAR
jgi:serine/threonine protein kinase/formylglycine-generating enzyme required for sulfatase activity/cephalosporin-C deacetylase-like acetyl esterase